MEQRIKDRYSNDILMEVMCRFGIGKDQIKILDSFESYIYEFENSSGSFILRISHSIRRNESLVQSEVDWINYLADHGISVSKAIVSQNGNLVEAVDDHQGGEFLATAFVKAQGETPWDLWTPALYETYGELIGKMHSLSQKYHPISPEMKRPEWDDPIFDFVGQFLPESENKARSRFKTVCEYVNSLPKNNNTYGLIHQDAHGGNLLIDDKGVITLFDFDDCCYSWFINDIAIVLFYIVMDAEDWGPFTQEFMLHFLHGYLRHCSLDLNNLNEIPYFLKIRELELYAVIHRDFNLPEIDNPWISRFMENRKYNIENDVPFIDFDFGSLKSMI